MIFAVATYGGRHIGMLLAHLQSLDAAFPGTAVRVYHQDLPEPQRAALQSAFPAVQWVRTSFDFTKDRIERISSKTLAWDRAIREAPPGETVALLDVDTLVVRDFRPLLPPIDWDVIFTWKDERFVLNTGVLLCRATPATAAFFTAWQERSIAILRDPARSAQANDSRLPYGAADQMALHELLGYTPGRVDYEVPLGELRARMHGIPCEYLNETNSAPITERTHIIHYKGGWQPILLDGRRFTRNRPRACCWEMYQRYLATFSAGLERVNAGVGPKWSAADFHVHIPAYLGAESRLSRQLLYLTHNLKDYLRSLGELAAGAIRVLTRRLPLCRS